MPLSMDELRSKGAVCIENVIQGMNSYHNRTEKLSAAEAEDSLRKMWTSGMISESFVDFYYFILDEDAKAAVRAVLGEEDLSYLEKKEKELLGESALAELRTRKAVIFPLEEQLLKIAVTLNEKEMLFSTFYFIGEETSTWWGNYNQEYIIFLE